jgi:hypothetical protein
MNSAPKQNPKGPTEKEFNIPSTDKELEKMIETKLALGMRRPETESFIITRRMAYNKPCSEFKRDHNIPAGGTEQSVRKGRKTVLKTQLSDKNCN